MRTSEYSANQYLSARADSWKRGRDFNTPMRAYRRRRAWRDFTQALYWFAPLALGVAFIVTLIVVSQSINH